MSVDYTSLLIAVAFSGAAVLLAAFASWISARSERYLVFGAIGLGFVSTAVGLMALRNGHYDVVTLLGPFSLLLIGLSFVYASVRTYVGGKSFWPPAIVGILSIVSIAIPFLTGYLGAGYFMLNATSGLILLLCGIEHIGMRDEMRTAMYANATLYVLTAATFLLCSATAVPQLDGDWTRYPDIDSWADSLNAVMSLVGVAGIGALTLSMHFARSARLNRSAANTDPLTGVFNRRALFERFPENRIVKGLAVMVFDLDHFKQINDMLGHAQGDTTLQWFVGIMCEQVDKSDFIARIGGEEFCLVAPERDRKSAMRIAESIRAGFAELAIPSGREGAIATVSVGLATGGCDEPFRSVLCRADAALYKAKHAGRNTVLSAEKILAA